jgi:hypothetical protein
VTLLIIADTPAYAASIRETGLMPARCLRLEYSLRNLLAA